jgi:hypothetical protein
MNTAIKLTLPVLLMGLVAGCSTPQEKCIRQTSQSYWELQNSIKKTESNIARGYALHEQTVETIAPSTCSRSNQYTHALEYFPCARTHYKKTATPVAIDVKQERVKLAEYQELLPSYKMQADEGILQCRRQYG